MLCRFAGLGFLSPSTCSPSTCRAVTTTTWPLSHRHKRRLINAHALHGCRNKNGQLVLGDIITGIDSRPVKSQKDLFNILDDCKVFKPANATFSEKLFNQYTGDLHVAV